LREINAAYSVTSRLHVVLEGISRGFSAVKIRNCAHYAPTYLWSRDGWERSIRAIFLVTVRWWWRSDRGRDPDAATEPGASTVPVVK